MGFLGSCSHLLFLQTVDLTLTPTLSKPGKGQMWSSCLWQISSRKLRNGNAASRHADRKQKERAIRRLREDATMRPEEDWRHTCQ